ncbi:MAG TPA: acyltransferase, partial [Candidatus Aquilonibacter sp.]|nr:acyltransferase [Candidatus Aquilonibacter sp.]
MKERLGVLDGLRGIAILQVLWFHLWVLRGISEPVPWLQFLPKTGNFGVHLFFFLSGFVIVFPFVRAQRANQPEPQWTHFAWRRFIKIVPSYALSIAIAYAVGFAAVERSHATILAELVTHALFIHTWWPSTATSINGVLWTLAIEAEFYAIFPLLWWLFKRRPWATGLALIALSWALRMWRATFLAPAVVNALSGNLPNFVDLFAFGMLCAWCVAHFGETARAPEQRFRMSALAAVGTAVIIGTFIGIGNGRAFYPNVYLHEV